MPRLLGCRPIGPRASSRRRCGCRSTHRISRSATRRSTSVRRVWPSLRPGDSVRIPEYQPSVRVTGAVNSPGSVLYRKGAGLDYYLSGAGGFTRNAEKGQVSVRYANGEVKTRRRSLLFSSNPAPGPGSEVSVPAKDPNAPHTDTVALFGAIAQILASTVAIIVIATR